MTRKVDRRQALATFGVVSLGGFLAACGEEDNGSSGSSGSGGQTEAPTKTPTS